MKNWLKLFSISFLFSVSSFANAVLIDFQAMGDDEEKGYSSLIINDIAGITGFTLTVKGYVYDGEIFNLADATPANAYLDAGTAGLGVCKKLGTLDGKDDQCDPRDDDNVTIDEWLTFSFTYTDGDTVKNIEIPELMVTLNNNHDSEALNGHTVWMDGDGFDNDWLINDAVLNGYKDNTESATYTYAYDTSSLYYIGHGIGEEEFYVESLQFGLGFRSTCVEGEDVGCLPVPEPSSLAIFSLALLGIIARRKKLI